MTGTKPPVRMLVLLHLFMNKVDECCTATKFVRSLVVEFPSANHRRGSTYRQVWRPSGDPFPPRAQRLPAYWPRQIHLSELRPGGGNRGGFSPCFWRDE